MKELSIEEKAKAYDELLVKLQKAKVDNNVCDDRYCCVIDDIVPELKGSAESEDEEIRTGLIGYFSDFHLQSFAGLDPKKILAWLEKQGEQKHQYKSRPRYVGETELLGEQKPADKVEPKFNVGDVVVRELDNTCYQIKKCILNVTNNKYGYDLTSGGYISSQDANFYHLYTIEDAKVGDVLVDMCDSLDNPLIFILKDCKHIKHELATLSDYHSFCYLKASEKQEFCIDGWHNEHNLMPATKEQRDLLFQKMHDAGYEWDAEKLELKKVEQKPEERESHEHWSDEQTRMNLLYFVNTWGKATLPLTSVNRFVNYLEKQGKQKPAWSEEDEANLDYLIDFCNGYYNGNKPVLTESTARALSNWLYRLKSCEIMSSTNKIDNEEAEKTIHLACEFIRHHSRKGDSIGGIDCSILIERLKSLKDRVAPQPKQEWNKEDSQMYGHVLAVVSSSEDIDMGKKVEMINWFKSLRPQPHWKPSDDEMEALSKALSLANNCGEESAFDLRTLYENLKKLREE